MDKNIKIENGKVYSFTCDIEEYKKRKTEQLEMLNLEKGRLENSIVEIENELESLNK